MVCLFSAFFTTKDDISSFIQRKRRWNNVFTEENDIYNITKNTILSRSIISDHSYYMNFQRFNICIHVVTFISLSTCRNMFYNNSGGM